MIRALMVSTSYPADASDWRGVFIRHLVEAFSRRTDLSMRIWSPPGGMPANLSNVASPHEQRWLASLMAAGGVSHLMRNGGIHGLTAPLRLLGMLRSMYRRIDAVDIYHVNWLQNALMLPRGAQPVLMTVLGNDLRMLALPGMRTLLRRACRGRATAICPNAEWMVPQLEAAFGDIAAVRSVAFGIDPSWFEVERTLSSEGPRRWLCVSRLTRAKLGPLFAQEASFVGQGRELHLFGPMQEQVEVPDWVHYHGAVSPRALCADWFPRAHGLISLSTHAEGRPQVMLEAMAAGLPIIASPLPAHAGLIRHGQTGWLCQPGASLDTALNALEDTGVNLRIGRAARAWVAEDIGTWDDCADRYVRVYQQLLAQAATHG